MNCHILITSPTDTAITLTFLAFTFEADTYCTYDNFAVYDYSTVDGSTSLIGTYCGTNAPGSILSNNNALYIVIYSDGSIQRTGANVGYVYSNNSYPNCKAGYTSYTATSTVLSLSNTNSPYLSNQDEYFLVENPTGGNLILQLSAMSIERASGCTYDRLTIYNGACTKNSVLDIHCGTFLKRWELTGTEYLVHFHSDSSIEKNGFTLQYFLGVSGTGAPTTTTTTIGPPVSAEVFLINDVLTNYSTENFPVRNLSTPVESVVEVYLAGVNSLDEVPEFSIISFSLSRNISVWLQVMSLSGFKWVWANIW
ncbi:tolloid-like protein 2 [Mercenaria mercenaria]|uniref:tolloid-like protein 2 n=1 Tax=Mercenaria mercenaria TaxID=6596 RepID=UPI00234E59FC|nr:tolloid-like protein 2 [Mercenaria mercenaria]